MTITCPRCGNTHLSWYAGKLRCHCGQTWVWDAGKQDYIAEVKPSSFVFDCAHCGDGDALRDDEDCAYCGEGRER